MLLNQLKFALRHISRAKTFSAINIAGLATSLTAFILMALYIENELSYDKFNAKADRIYRIVDDKKTNALTQHTASSAGPLAPALLHDFAQIKQAARVIEAEALIKYRAKAYEERNVFYADASLFGIFDFKMMQGDSATALSKPGTVVLTEAIAKKYFGTESPVGKAISVDGKVMAVTGVIKNVPANSHISFDVLLSMATAEQQASGYNWLFTNWYSNNFYTYVLLQPEYDVRALTGQFPAFANRHNVNTAETKHHFNVEKLTDIYLHSDRENQVGKTGNLRNLYIFGAVALFILFLACINFVNLSTARAAERAKEVAIKKVNGVSRGHLVMQFFIESFITAGIAVAIAAGVCYLLLPVFNNFAGTEISMALITPMHLMVLAAIMVATGVMSGTYPALVLSAFKPAATLKGALQLSFAGTSLRKFLVVFQFTVSIILIISSIVVYTQLKFMQTAKLGFNPQQTMVINFEGDHDVQQQYERIKRALLHVPGVTGVTASSKVPGLVSEGSGWSMDVSKKTGDTVHTEMPVFAVDFGFMHQYMLKMVAGRAFSPLFPEDTVGSMIINEAALRKLGFAKPEDAVGVNVGMYPTDAKVIGVCKDFHFQSLQKEIGPLALRVLPGNFRYFSVAVTTGNIPNTISSLENTWKKVAPQRPLEYNFLQETFNRQYKSETKFGELFLVFTILAIIIACFGLFGLALFNVKQRTKEIGIRKVVGASVLQITALLAKDFIILVLAALVIAAPIAFAGMHKWLETYAYRTSFAWWMFAAGGAIAGVAAIVTVGYQAVKAARVNPVKSLKA